MKLKFTLLTFLLIFSRGCDFYSTSLWFFQPNGIKDERNPLTYFFGVGWNGLVIVNIIIIMITIILLYFFYFLYKRPVKFAEEANNYKDLASLQYFGEIGKYNHLLYKIPKNKKVLLAHIGYVLTISIIIGSLIATLHNLNQFYQLGLYNKLPLIIGPLYFIYFLIALTVVITYRMLLIQEFKKYKTLIK